MFERYICIDRYIDTRTSNEIYVNQYVTRGAHAVVVVVVLIRIHNVNLDVRSKCFSLGFEASFNIQNRQFSNHAIAFT